MRPVRDAVSKVKVDGVWIATPEVVCCPLLHTHGYLHPQRMSPVKLLQSFSSKPTLLGLHSGILSRYWESATYGALCKDTGCHSNGEMVPIRTQYYRKNQRYLMGIIIQNTLKCSGNFASLSRLLDKISSWLHLTPRLPTSPTIMSCAVTSWVIVCLHLPRTFKWSLRTETVSYSTFYFPYQNCYITNCIWSEPTKTQLHLI